MLAIVTSWVFAGYMIYKARITSNVKDESEGNVCTVDPGVEQVEHESDPGIVWLNLDTDLEHPVPLPDNLQHEQGNLQSNASANIE